MAVNGAATTVAVSVPRVCEEVAVENSILSVATIDLYDDDVADEALHGSPAARIELPQTDDAVQVPDKSIESSGDCALVTMSKTATADGGASDDDCENDGDMPTPSTASLLARLQAPRRFKTAAWQPHTSARRVTQNNNEAQMIVEGQAQQQRAAAAAAKQRREEWQQRRVAAAAAAKRAESEGDLRRSGSQMLQPNCEVYSTSSGAWIAGTYVAADEILPNTVRVQYTSATGSTMQKLLKAESPHLRKNSTQDLTSNVSEADQKDSANELVPKRLCLGEVTNHRTNVAVPSQAAKTKRRGPRNGGGGYKRRYKA
jgi:hypothetical protein